MQFRWIVDFMTLDGGGTEKMHDIPETGFLRLTRVLTVIPIGKTCWWEGVKAGASRNR